jgi:hypothetical protein
MDDREEDPEAEAHPQCVSRSKLNLRRRKLRSSSNPAAEATKTSDTNCCQSMVATYPQTCVAQLIVPARVRMFLVL